MSSNHAVYNWDQLGRLTQVVFPNGAMASYSYDVSGNRTTVMEVPASSPPSCCPPTVTGFPKRIKGDFKNDAMVVLLSTGELIGWGDTTSGSIANGVQAATMSLPQRLVFDPNTTVPPSTATIVNWVLTNANLYVVYSNGWVYSAGANSYGQLGKGDTTARPYLSRIEYFVTEDVSVTQVWASGGYSTTDGGGAVYFQASNYEMYGCGLNTTGNLGLGTTTNVETPAPISSIPYTSDHVIDVVAVTVDVSVSCYMLFNNGALYVAGYNTQGQLAQNTTTNVTSFVSALNSSSEAVTTAASISANSGSEGGNALFVDTSGNVWTVGYNAHGELGLANTTETKLFTQVTALSGISKAELGGGLYGFGYALNESGTLYTWGYNGQNNLFQNSTTTPQSTPSAAPDVPPGVISKVFFSKGNEGLSTTPQMILLMTNSLLAYAGADVGQQGVDNDLISGAYSLLPTPMFITDGTDSITDVFVHGAGLLQRWFIITELGNLYACGDNTNAICTAAVAGTTPAGNAAWARISFVL